MCFRGSRCEMLWLRCGLLLFMTLTVSDAVKVNMVGSLSLGKDVMGVLEEYVRKNLIKGQRMQEISGRRMMSPPDVHSAIKTAALCKGLIFCSGDTEQILNDYIEALSKAISVVFEGILQNDAFEHTSKKYIQDVKKVLKHANSKVHEENEVFTWTEVLKKISTALLENAIQFATERLDDPLADKTKATQVIMQQLIIAVGRVETEYLTKLCTAHKVCRADLECTQALNIVFEPMKTMQESKLKVFVKVFRILLIETPLWTKLDVTVREEFKNVLNDMVKKPDSAVRDILLAFRRVLTDRLARTEPSAIDVLLINCILSDMDHVYSQNKRSFDHFLSKFDDWVNQGGQLETHMKKLFKDITNRLDDQPEEFTRRLTNHVNTFLELAVGNGTNGKDHIIVTT